ncbi:MAG TPA: hypothetical protein VLH38_01695 [Patescibacteria group bacterium]|nr:hypothetical protein [Patescibacteria group bacterium]
MTQPGKRLDFLSQTQHNLIAAERDYTNIVLGEINLLADDISRREGSRVTFEEYMLAMHGINTETGNQNSAQAKHLSGYNELLNGFSGKDGEPIAKLSSPCFPAGKRDGEAEGAPEWIGVVSGELTFSIKHREDRGLTSFMGKVSLHIVAPHSIQQDDESKRAAHKNTQPGTLSNANLNFTDPGTLIMGETITYSLGLASRSAGELDSHFTAEHSRVLAVGWQDIERRYPFEHAGVDKALYLQRLAALAVSLGL